MNDDVCVCPLCGGTGEAPSPKSPSEGPYALKVRYQDCWDDGVTTFTTFDEAKSYAQSLYDGPLGKSAMYYVMNKGGRPVAVLSALNGWEYRK